MCKYYKCKMESHHSSYNNMAKQQKSMNKTQMNQYIQKKLFLKSIYIFFVIINNRLIDLTAKENAIEDCLVAIKKAYEKDLLTLGELMQNVRRLSNKQFKSILKRNKLTVSISGK